MYKSGSVLDSAEKLLTAQKYGLHVVVYQDGKLIGFGGPIVKFDEIAVKINGSWYMRQNCEFRVR